MLNKAQKIGALIGLWLLALVVLVGPSTTTAQAPYFFPETGYTVATDAIWDYFQDRGGVDTFGYPVSTLLTHDGFSVQIFQRHVLQIAGDVVRPLNLLDPQVMPINSYGGLTFPQHSPAVAMRAPPPGAPDYANAVLAHIGAAVPDSWEGEAVNFRTYFYGAALSTSGALLGLIALEVWGFPTSMPARDPHNSNFIYQRFQRGIMHYDKTQGVTRGILLGDAFKEMIGSGGGTPPTPADSVFLGVEINPGAFSDQVVAQAAASGANAVRASGIFWDRVEAQPGRYEWSQMATHDNSIRRISEAGLIPMIIFRNTPEWARQTPSHLCSAIRADALDEFANFVEATVERYSAPPFNVHHWELFNEPDIDPALVGGDSGFGCWGNADDPYYGGAQYATMLKVAHPAIKRADPSATVYLGGLLLDCDPTHPPPTKSCGPARFFEGILRTGGGPYFDVVTYHAYGLWNSQAPDADATHPDWSHRGGALIGKAEFLREVMAAYGVSKPVLMNECGLLCREGNPECPSDRFFDDQARYVPRMYARSWAHGIQGAFWYTLNGPGWRQGGLLNRDGSARPAFTALQTFSTRLADARYIRSLSTGALEGYEFQRGDRTIQLYWMTNSTTRTLPLSENTLAIYDYLGRLLPVTSQLTVDSGPVYIESSH